MQYSNAPLFDPFQSDNIFVTWDGLKNPKTMHIGDFDVSKVIDKNKMSFTQNIGTRTLSSHDSVVFRT
jgi:hypothetical protein